MENANLLQELCNIAHTRNELNAKRLRAAWRRSYYKKAISAIKTRKKWTKMGSLKLRLFMLKAEADYVTAKCETMEFSSKTRTRVKHLTSLTNMRLKYNNGYISCLISKVDFTKTITKEEIERQAMRFRVDIAVHKILET